MGGVRTGGVFEYYRYTPSASAAAAFAVLYGLATILHSYQLWRTRAWIMIPFVLGGIAETIGYAGRIISSGEAPNFTIGPFLLQTLGILWGPALFAATVYMCLGRIIRATGGEKYSLLKPSLVTKIFVSGDVAGLVIQGAGSGTMTIGTLADYYTGSNIVIGGLALLVASFGLFIVLALTFDIRMRRNPTPEALTTPLDWRRDLMALYAVSALIFVRSTFRLVEYAQGNSGWLISHEWCFYVFDSSLIFSVIILFSIIHPSHVAALLKGGVYSRWMGAKFETVPAIAEAKEEV